MGNMRAYLRIYAHIYGYRWGGIRALLKIKYAWKPQTSHNRCAMWSSYICTFFVRFILVSANISRFMVYIPLYKCTITRDFLVVPRLKGLVTITMCIARPDPVCTQRTQPGRLGSNRFYKRIKTTFLEMSSIFRSLLLKNFRTAQKN